METPQETLKHLPHAPGIYIYKNRVGEILYVGKAKDLKKRVPHYKNDVFSAHVASIDTIQTASEFDALLLEAKLIRKFLPKYNLISRDDKSPLYIAITHETLPRILWLRKTSLSLHPKATLFGPFQSGSVVRTVLRQIRHIIPYCTQKRRNGKPCFYSHLGLCDPCPSAIQDKKQIKEYRKNIRRITAILSGKSLTLLHALESEMMKCASKNQFEGAQIFKKRILGLRQLHARHVDPMMYIQNETFAHDIRHEEQQSLQKTLGIPTIRRIECIDISNTQGNYSTGSLVVFIDGLPSTRDYRRFKIRTKEAPNDFAMIAEVVRRRFAHAEWPLPDLLVIDGGKGQVKAALFAPVPVIGLAKRREEIIAGGKTLRLPIHDKGLQLLMRLRDETHRFALAYHRLLRSRAFLPKI